MCFPANRIFFASRCAGFLAVAALSCLFPSLGFASGIPLPAEAPVEIHGCWQQLDDGRLLEISKDSADFFHHSQLVTYKATPASGLPLAESYSSYELKNAGATLLLWRDDYGDKFDGFYHEEFRRIDHLPESVVLEPETDARFSDPKFVFDLVCEQFDVHFPHFERRQFDWESRKRKFRQQLTDEMSLAQLDELLCQMLKGLGDSHTRIYSEGRDRPFKSGEAKIVGYFDSAFAQQTEFAERGDFVRAWAKQMKSSAEALAEDRSLKTAANGRFRWGVFQGNVGYIELETITGFHPSGLKRPEEIEFLGSELDRMLFELKDCRAIIFDLSFNGGGYDPASWVIASRFADRRRHVLSFNAAQRNTPSRKCFVGPAGEIQFTKPVYVLTTNGTVSSGEILVMMLKAFPHVTHVGETTRGCLSSFLNKWMPNGLHITLSNETYAAPDGSVYEGVGISPEIEFPVFSEESLFDSYPAALKKALQLAMNGE